jgi:hypothetical protein
MSNSYRIRTKVGVDKSIKVLIDQDFEYLEILSLKLLQNQIYTRQCSDYGVVIGRVTANNGYGIPNAKVSIFIPLSAEDENNPIISDLYPYKSLTQLNDEGYRYNLLPYVKSYSEHVPTGTFFTREDVLIEPSLIEVFDKYYKYTARTNDSGDFMIFGVPVGSQTIHVDIDLSDIGEFSLSPQDLIRMGNATEAQVSGNKFKSSTNLAELPQIISINRTIEVEPLWGQPEICSLGITRTDFDLTEESNIVITPTAIFMGSIFSDVDSMALKANCKPRFKQGELCSLITGPGEILAIRQTIRQDINGRPLLEVFTLESGGQVIDDNGTWLIDVPMNLDFVTTNEFGEKVLSNDPSIGVPTKAKYRFKIKWNQSPSLSEDTKRGYFLVPNVREYGWNANGTAVTNLNDLTKSYSFSLDWNDYVDIQSAINCEDTFYSMLYNKVYSVSQLIDQHRRGNLPARFISVKNILDDTCESENNKYPTNDGYFRLDIIYLVFLFAMIVFRPIIYALIFVIHVLYAVLTILKFLMPLLLYYVFKLMLNEISAAAVVAPAFGLMIPFILKAIAYLALFFALIFLWIKLIPLKLKPINVPVLLYDQCEFCDCDDPDDLQDDSYDSSIAAGTAPPGGQETSTNNSGLQLSQFYSNTYFTSQSASNPLLATIGSIMAGEPFKTDPPQPPSCDARVPGLKLYTDSSNRKTYYLSNSLTIAEGINLFNTKAKFFEPSLNNPGGGANRITVSFDTTGTTLTPQVNAHYDNIVFLMLTPDSGQNLNAGDLITFQNPSLSFDKNLTGGTRNVYNNNAITGNSVYTTSYSKQIQFADPTTPGTNLTVNYTLPPPNSADTNYHKFPVDVEYFQVVTAMTYTTFSNNQSGAFGQSSLFNRFIYKSMTFYPIADTASSSVLKNTMTNPPIDYNAIINFQDYSQQICVILVRGVDPYSSRIPVRYELGRIFGYTNTDDVVVEGLYKLNQPIVGGFKNVAHDILTNDVTDSYSASKLYFQNFGYQPSTQFSSFTSNLPSYYSKLDNNNTNPTSSCCTFPSGILSISSYGVKATSSLPVIGTSTVSTVNAALFEFTAYSPQNISPAPQVPGYYDAAIIPNPNGYYGNEVVEGGSLMVINTTFQKQITGNPDVKGYYVSMIYPNTTTLSYDVSLQSSRNLVMRSDRLPSSTENFNNCGISYLLQNNSALGIYKIPDTGYIGSVQQQPNPSMSTGAPDAPVFSSQTLGNDVIDSLNNCQDAVPLECYDYANNKFTVAHDCEIVDGERVWENGCYKFVTKIILSIPTDLKLLTEWLARINITFGACRNVFSHTFTNNWINGSLYAYAFKNNRIFNTQNVASSDYCEQGLYLHPTNNFYYRSSPYYQAGGYFCGDKNPTGIQNFNLKYPTTIIDLGPRNFYLQEIIMSDDYDGYIVNKVRTSTFGDVSDLLNIFIISRLANTSFIQLIFSTQGANIFSYFNQRRNFQVDADYAQMISINSEFGVDEFESENYPSAPLGSQDPIYFNGGNAADGIFGIFFKSNLQDRDFISPKRTIIDSNLPPITVDDCTYSYFNVFTQKVPFYQWEVFANPDTDSIFGSQKNTWYTVPTNGNQFFSHPYQQMDRTQITSRYHTVTLSNNQSYFKGYIWGYSGTDLSPSTTFQNQTNGRILTVGAPQYFYFGLKKGKSAWDRFAKKWINFEIITD